MGKELKLMLKQEKNLKFFNFLLLYLNFNKIFSADRSIYTNNVFRIRNIDFFSYKAKELKNSKKFYLFCKKTESNFYFTLTNSNGGVVVSLSSGNVGASQKKHRKSKYTVNFLIEKFVHLLNKNKIHSIDKFFINNLNSSLAQQIFFSLKKKIFLKDPIDITPRIHSKLPRKKKQRRL